MQTWLMPMLVSDHGLCNAVYQAVKLPPANVKDILEIQFLVFHPQKLFTRHNYNFLWSGLELGMTYVTKSVVNTTGA